MYLLFEGNDQRIHLSRLEWCDRRDDKHSRVYQDRSSERSIISCRSERCRYQTSISSNRDIDITRPEMPFDNMSCDSFYDKFIDTMTIFFSEYRHLQERKSLMNERSRSKDILSIIHEKPSCSKMNTKNRHIRKKMNCMEKSPIPTKSENRIDWKEREKRKTSFRIQK